MKKSHLHPDLTSQKVLVMGLGLNYGGEAAVQWLSRHGAKVKVTDKKTKSQLAPTLRRLRSLHLEYTLGHHHRADIKWADFIVQNPGVPSTAPELQYAQKLGKPIVNEASLFFQHVPGPVIGVTGTRGKTTTTLLIAHILKAAKFPAIAAGNLREVPMLSIIDRLKTKNWAVVELSSFQLENLKNIRQSPHIAVWTNLLVDHLNRYASLSAYAQAKSQIIRYQQKSDFAVLNADSAVVKKMSKLTSAQIIWFSAHGPIGQWSIFLKEGKIFERKGRRTTLLASLKDFPLAGNHQVHNLMAALAAARAANVPLKVFPRAIKTFPGVRDRQELIRTWRGHQWINDTTATTPDGTLAALNVFPSGVFIMGGTDKKLNYRKLTSYLQRQPVPLVLLPGTATEIMRRQLRRYRAPLFEVDSMTAAVRRAATLAQPGQTIILSPGAASFGLFRHEFDRGDAFRRAVQQLT